MKLKNCTQTILPYPSLHNILRSKLFFICVLVCISVNGYGQTLRGRIIDIDKVPVFPVLVQISGDANVSMLNNPEGYFELTIGEKHLNDSLILSSLGYKTIILPVRKFLVESPFEVLMDVQVLEMDEVIVVAKPSVTKEFAIESMTGTDIYMTAGASADPLKAISMLSYSTNTSETANPELRGSSGDFSRVILNNVPIYKPVRNQQLNVMGNFSLLNLEIIDKQDVYAGNPPLKYGNTIAGLVDLQTKKRLDVDKNLILNVSLATLGAMYSTRINNKSFIQLYGNYQFSSLYKGVNNKHLDYLDKFHTKDLGLNFSYNFSRSLNFNVYSYFIDEGYVGDNYLLNYEGSSDAKKKRNFNILNLTWQQDKFTFSINNGTDFSQSNYLFGNMDEKHNENNIYTSLDFKYYITNPNITLQTGISQDHSKHDFKGFMPQSYIALKPTDPTYALDEVISNNNLEMYFYGKYIPIKSLILGLGLRKNLPNNNQDNYLSYQFNTRYNISKSSSLIFAFGRYNGYSMPEYRLKTIENIQSEQYSLEYMYIKNKIKLKSALYYKIETTPVFYNETNDANETDTRFRGFEISLDYKLSKKFQLYLAYTFIDVDFKLPNAPERYRSYNDMPYMLKFAVSYFNPKIFNVGVNFTCKPGQYYTPMISAMDSPSITHPIIYGSYNASQYNTYSSLDLTVNRYFKVKRTSVVIYASINNILNRDNQRYSYYNENFTETKYRHYQKRMIYFGFRFSL